MVKLMEVAEDRKERFYILVSLHIYKLPLLAALRYINPDTLSYILCEENGAAQGPWRTALARGHFYQCARIRCTQYNPLEKARSRCIAFVQADRCLGKCTRMLVASKKFRSLGLSHCTGIGLDCRLALANHVESCPTSSFELSTLKGREVTIILNYLARLPVSVGG